MHMPDPVHISPMMIPIKKEKRRKERYFIEKLR
jgi:hypothetical protein